MSDNDATTPSQGLVSGPLPPSMGGRGAGGHAANTPDAATAELIRIAQAARTHAYAPYSNYNVGAAVRTADGRVFFGCNVENASYGLTCCAERNAVFAAVAAGGREIVAVAVVTKDGGSPCGACRQVLSEFRPKDGMMQILLADETGNLVLETTIAELLPLAFELYEGVGTTPRG